MRVRQGIIIGLLLALVTLLSGCSVAGPPVTLKVLVSSELQDLEPLLGQIQRATGISLDMEYVGTLAGTEQLVAGRADVDLAWFASAKYLTLLQGNSRRALGMEKTMLSPVVVGVKTSLAQKWGWRDNDAISWQDVLTKVASGELQLGMSNPSSSNSGFSALVGVASALSGQGDVLQSEDVDRIMPQLAQFLSSQALTSGSSGWLAAQYVEEQDRLGGLVNYESVLLGLNKGRTLREKLYLVYPREGILTADYTLMLLQEDRREAYDRLVAYVHSDDFQKAMMRETLRRPVNTQVRLSGDIPNKLLIELPFPNKVEVLDRLVLLALREQRIPAHTFFVVDLSGSMRGEGLMDLKQALNDLIGTDAAGNGLSTRFDSREIITLIPFSTAVRDVQTFEIDLGDASTTAGLRDYVDNLQAGGDSALYDALAEAYRLAGEARRERPERNYAIVLMSDGEVTAGMTWARFRRVYRDLPKDAQGIQTHVILSGETDEKVLEQIAGETGGQAFDIRIHELSLIFKQIRGYQ